MLKTLKKHEEKFVSVALCALALVMLGAISFYFIGNKARQKEIDKELSRNDKSNLISVYVGGEVINPGEYSLKEGARVGDAIEAAGGFTENANEKINIAFMLCDGEKVLVADKEHEPNSGIAYKVNLNTATESELMTIDGVGEKMAQRIIAHREEKGGFKSLEEILEIPGIGEKIYENMKNFTVAE